MKARDGIWALAGDKDGIDWVEDAAGALIAPDTLVRMHRCGFDPKQMLAHHETAIRPFRRSGISWSPARL
ncbi:MOFRL family protein [Sinorhizobium americanum]|uniref:MOFRL family protein n=1 Tax=Sinorhizobium americanum TaxID=194963 RepID=UPI003CC955FA